MASVIVVGGGVAGLTCAWRLARAGHDVQVLEREDKPGGRMRSERHQGFVIDRGAQFVASGYRNLHAVAAALGVDAALHPLAQTRNAILRDGRLEAGDYGEPLAFVRSRLLSTRSKLRLPRILWDLLRHARRLEPLRPERAAALDCESMPDYLRRVVGEETLEYLFAPAFSSTFDSDPEDLSGAFALLVLRFVTSGFRLQAFAGGIGTFTRALAERVPVRTGCAVTRVESTDDGVRVDVTRDGAEGDLRADAAVVAVPGSLVAGLCPKLTPAERTFFERVRYVRGAIVHLALDAPPATLPYYGVAFPRREGVGLYGLAVDHHKPGAVPEGAGLLNTALTAASAARLWDAPDDALVAFALDALARTPVGRLTPHFGVVHRWSPMLPQFHTGYLKDLAAFQARGERSPRLAFAGDYLVGPYTEAALTSGMRAATEIAGRL